jgi:uncharacterized Ntn-hydrolase superfamily protein
VTWSIIALDTATGSIGIAVATKFFAVGARVPAIEAGVGAVASQALTNPLYRQRGLALMRLGVPAAEVVKLLIEADSGHPHRQVHVMDSTGRFAAHTGAECVDWCGHTIRETFSVAGNMLAGPQVIAETARAYEANASLPFPRRLIAAFKAGEDAGGDKRGKQSAALVIYGNQEYSELDLRVDDHIEPLLELARLESVSRERWTHFRAFVPTRENPAGIFDRAAIDAGIERSLAAERQ